MKNIANKVYDSYLKTWFYEQDGKRTLAPPSEAKAEVAKVEAPKKISSIAKPIFAFILLIVGVLFSLAGSIGILQTIVFRVQVGDLFMDFLITAIIMLAIGLGAVIGLLRLIEFKFRLFMSREKSIISKMRIIYVFPILYSIFVLGTAIDISFIDISQVQNTVGYLIGFLFVLMEIIVLALAPQDSHLPYISKRIRNLKEEMAKNERLWLETHYDFIRFESIMAYVFLYSATFIVATNLVLKNYDQILWAIIWLEVAYILAIALFKLYRNWLGMDYKEIEGASLQGSKAFAKLSYNLFDEDFILGLRGLRYALTILKKCLEKDEMTNNQIENGIIITTLYENKYKNMDEDSRRSIKEISRSLSDLPNLSVVSEIEKFIGSSSELIKGFSPSRYISENVRDLVLSLMGLLIGILAIFQGPLSGLELKFLMAAQILLAVIILYLIYNYIPKKLQLEIKREIVERYIDRL